MYVTTYALCLIKTEYDLLKRKHDNHEDIEPCTHRFKRSLGLPCQHIIQRRIDQGVPLKITDIQYHWQFYKARPTRDLDAELVWDSWPANLPRPQALNFIEDDVSPPPQSHVQSCPPTPQLREPTPSTPESVLQCFLPRAQTPLSEDERQNNNQEAEPNDYSIDPIFIIQNPLRAKTKGRLPDALNKKRTIQEAEFEDSTRREPSRFEYEEVNQRRRTLRGRVQGERAQGRETQEERIQGGEIQEGGPTTQKPQGRPKGRPKGGKQKQVVQNRKMRGPGTQRERTQGEKIQGEGTQVKETQGGGLTTRKPRGRPRGRPKGGNQG